MMKKIIGAVAALVLGSAAFAADSGLYAKLNAGFNSGSVYIKDGSWHDTTGFSGFELFPAIGFCPAATSIPDKPFDFTFEASLGLIFGSGDEYSNVDVKVVNPGFTCFFNWHFENTDSAFLKNFVPYGGAGISTPIQMVEISWEHTYADGWDDYGHANHWRTDSWSHKATTIGCDLTFVVGARYAFSDKIEANAETGWNAAVMNGMGGGFLRGGIFYRF